MPALKLLPAPHGADSHGVLYGKQVLRRRAKARHQSSQAAQVGSTGCGRHVDQVAGPTACAGLATAPPMPGAVDKYRPTTGGDRQGCLLEVVGSDRARPVVPEGAALLLRALAEALVDEVVRLRNDRGLTGKQIVEHFRGGDEETNEQQQ